MATKCLCSLGVFGMGVQHVPQKIYLFCVTVQCLSCIIFAFLFLMVIPSLIKVAAEYIYLITFFVC